MDRELNASLGRYVKRVVDVDGEKQETKLWVTAQNSSELVHPTSMLFVVLHAKDATIPPDCPYNIPTPKQRERDAHRELRRLIASGQTEQ